MLRGKRFIASVFLLFFAILQMADLHIIQHDADDKDCMTCQISSTNQTDDHYSFLSTDYSIDLIEVFVKKEEITHNYIQVDIPSNYICTNKAPPAIS